MTSLALAERITENFNEGWRFAPGEQADGASPQLNDNGWKPVRVPHDWAIAGPFDPKGSGNTGKLPWRGEGWYRKKFKLPTDQADRKVYFLFDGVMAQPEIWINGKRAGGWDYGYNSFWIDATKHIEPGKENLIAVHVDTRKHRSRWYPGAGMYRKVTMHVTGPVHAGHWGMHVTTPTAEKEESVAIVRCRVENHRTTPHEAKIGISLLGPDGAVIGEPEPQTQTIPARGSVVVEHKFKVPKAKLWDIKKPTLYTARLKATDAEGLLDEQEQRFGFRKIEFTPKYGFYLNGRHLQLKGVNLHHDLGPLGAAFSKPALRRQLEMMQDMGANAIRTSHNAAAPELLDLCDELGLLVFNELFDKWDDTADLHDQSKFNEFMERQVGNFVRRDRNHPCVIVWSIGNEISVVEQNKEGKQKERVDKLVALFKKHDDTRPITLGCHMPKAALASNVLDSLDVLSWNYQAKYAEAKVKYPKKPNIYSESASALSSRGHYELPLPEKKTDLNKKTRQVSSYDLNAASWSDIPDVEFERMDRDRYCSGEFVWTGFDYLGEPTPFHDAWAKEVAKDPSAAARSSYFGIVDLAGIPKDRYYLYRSHWTPSRTTIHIVPHWNWPTPPKDEPAPTIPVFVYTNGDEAELFLNDKSLGKAKKNPKATSTKDNYYGVLDRYRLRWEGVAFEPGELKAVAYKDGKEIGTATIRTAGEPAALRLTPDCKDLAPDGNDLCFVLVEMVDSEGTVVPNADQQVKLTVTGPAEIAAIANGDPTSLESFIDAEHKLFNGQATLFLRSKKGEKGNVLVTATVEGVEAAKLKVEVK